MYLILLVWGAYSIMLKILFTVQSNVRYKNSNARLFRLYKRLYLFQCYFTSIFKGNKAVTGAGNITVSSTYRKHKVVIMRSPFHYKTSKTLLSQPKQNVTLLFNINTKNSIPLFFSNDFEQLVNNLNSLNILVFKKIRISYKP